MTQPPPFRPAGPQTPGAQPAQGPGKAVTVLSLQSPRGSNQQPRRLCPAHPPFPLRPSPGQGAHSGHGFAPNCPAREGGLGQGRLRSAPPGAVSRGACGHCPRRWLPTWLRAGAGRGLSPGQMEECCNLGVRRGQRCLCGPETQGAWIGASDGACALSVLQSSDPCWLVGAGTGGLNGESSRTKCIPRPQAVCNARRWRPLVFEWSFGNETRSRPASAVTLRGEVTASR